MSMDKVTPRGSITVTGLVGRIMRAYDRNNSGAIEYGTRPREMDRDETMHMQDRIVYSTWTRERLIREADKNHDGVTTRAEMEAVVKRFDANGDGKLETKGWFWNPDQEYDKFENAWHEDLVRQHIVPVAPQPPIPPFYPPVGPRLNGEDGKTMLA